MPIPIAERRRRLGALAGRYPGDKVKGVREAVRAVGAALVSLPPYSPDINPIEQVFAKIQALLRKYAERTVERLWDRLGNLPDQFPARRMRHVLPPPRIHCAGIGEML